MSHDLLERLAEEIRAARFGDGPEGLAAGQGLTILADDPPPGWRSCEDAGLVVVPCDGLVDSVLLEVAGTALRRRHIEHTVSDVSALARILGALVPVG